ncbi:MAG: hypothetical protein HQL08_13920 [Nitrospirae bacterium]|nr:hypothetical protein [Nitrospirota bacterium]
MNAGRFEALVYKINKTMSSDARSFSERLNEVVGLVARYFEVEKCSIMLINREDMTLEVGAATNNAIVGMKRHLSDVTVATRSLLEDEPFEADKKRLSYFVPADITKYTSGHSLSIPIKYNDKKIGVINITDTLNSKRLSKTKMMRAIEIAEQLAAHLYAAQADELLEKKIKNYEDAMAQLIKTDQMKTSLTSFIVHDLKGPISTIMANMDMLSYEQLSAEQIEFVTLALHDVYKMQRMVMNILDVMKLEEGKISIFREETDLSELVRQEIESIKSLLAMRDIEAVLDGEPRTMFVDVNLISRTIANLLLNAVEHCPDGKRITVDIRYDAASKETTVGVSDEGAGIPDEFKERIFDKFFQIETGKVYGKTTTGLGLTFCKLVVHAHGGRLWAEDNKGGGARLVFSLPGTIKGVID